MEILLPYAKPEYPWLKRAAIHVFNFEVWFAPAVADATADDVGDDYKHEVAALVSFAIVMAFFLPTLQILRPIIEVAWWWSVLFGVAMYNMFGRFYAQLNKRW